MALKTPGEEIKQKGGNVKTADKKKKQVKKGSKTGSGGFPRK
jgi:hypothetical protein